MGACAKQSQFARPRLLRRCAPRNGMGGRGGKHSQVPRLCRAKQTQCPGPISRGGGLLCKQSQFGLPRWWCAWEGIEKNALRRHYKRAWCAKQSQFVLPALFVARPQGRGEKRLTASLRAGPARWELVSDHAKQTQMRRGILPAIRRRDAFDAGCAKCVKQSQFGEPRWKGYEAGDSCVARATRKMAPVGRAESISTYPPCASAKRFTSVSPRPVPVVWGWLCPSLLPVVLPSKR